MITFYAVCLVRVFHVDGPRGQYFAIDSKKEATRDRDKNSPIFDQDDTVLFFSTVSIYLHAISSCFAVAAIFPPEQR
jgi:hypothetical protein